MAPVAMEGCTGVERGLQIAPAKGGPTFSLQAVRLAAAIAELYPLAESRHPMTHEELIAKAREHAAVFERGAPLPARVGEFARTRVRDTVLIHFGSNDRDDYIEILLDRESGDFITASYRPPPDTGAQKK